VCSCTAIEVTIRYFILKPLVQGVFLSDEWAEVLTKRIVSGKADRDREILPSILRFYELDINNIRLPSGEPVWQVLKGRIWDARNNYVHRGDPVAGELSAEGIKAATCMKKLANDVLVKALGWKEGNHQFGSENHGESPFT